MENGVNALADAMQYVGRAIEAQNERQQVEYVFGLTGGELSNESLKFTAPGRYGDVRNREWFYHYDGVPDWAEEDFKDPRGYYSHDFYGSDYFTLVEFGISYESSAPEELTTLDGKLYLRVRSYSSSGETECPMGSCGDNETVGEDSTEGMAQCPLCEADAGEKHGYIYLGNSAEHVYRHLDLACAGCGVLQSEIRRDEVTTCNCDDEE